MTAIDAPPSTAVAKAPLPARLPWLRTNWSVLLAIVALVVVILLPTPEGLSIAGQRMLAILAFAVIVWMTEALDYAVSAIIIAALMAFLLGLSPTQPIRRFCSAPAPGSASPFRALPIPRWHWSPPRCFWRRP